jgi:hypothetical protein
MPEDYHLERIATLMWGEGSVSTDELEHAVEALAEGGLLRRRDTSSYGYGDHYEPGPVVFSVTPKGLVYLWMGIS